MKKIVFAGLAAILMIASCEKNEPVPDIGEDCTQSLYIRLDDSNFAPTTKAITDARIADGAKFATPQKVYIFISAPDGTMKHIIPVATTADAANPLLDIDALKAGYQLQNIYKYANIVQIVGNPKSANFAGDMDAAMKAITTYDEVIALVNDIQYDNDPSELVLYGESEISSTQDGNVTRLSAAVSLNPLVSRFQITLNYDDTVIKEVTFEGVYIRNFYETTTFDNTGGTLNAQGSLEDSYTIDRELFKDTYCHNMFDYNAAGLDITKVFAYHFFPLASPVAGPEIVVRYTAKNINDNLMKLRFVRAIGFTDAGGATFSNWQSGKLYNVDIVVGRGSEDPVGENVTFDVSITVGDWVAVDLDPVYQ
ncbi:MAG: hypothetical protein WC520_04265 [Candidatus Paceibacterota bacterium]|jgi:hypothetical protein